MTHRLQLAICWLLALGLALAAPIFLNLTTPAPARAEQLQCGPVTRVIDGDTFEVRTAAETVRVRLWGVDAPESYWPSGRTATRYLDTRLRGKTVCLAIKDVGPHGRTVARVYVDGPRGPDLAEELLQKGLVRWVKSRAPRAENYRRAEAQARAARRGIWALDCDTGSLKELDSGRAEQAVADNLLRRVKLRSGLMMALEEDCK